MEAEPPIRPGAPAPRRALVLGLAIATFVLSAVRFAPVVDDPWDESIEQLIAPVYYARILHVYERFGFWEMLGAPYMRKLPITAELLPALTPELQAIVNVPYFRHPALTFWLTHLSTRMWGWSERSFRALPILASSATATMIVLLIAGWAGAGWAAAALLLLLVLPMSWFVGAMTGYEPYVLGFMTAAFFLHVRLRRASGPAYALVWLMVFLAGLSDWCGIGIVPGIWAFELMTPASERARRRRVWALVVPAGASVLASVALIMIWSGGIRAGIDSFVGLVKYATVPTWRPDDWTAPDWFVRVGTFWRSMFTLPVALLAALAIPMLVKRSRSPADALPRAALALLVPALLNVVVFVNHAYIHDYWWYYALPFVLLATTFALRGLCRAAAGVRLFQTRPRLLGIAAAIAVVALAANAAHRTRLLYREYATEDYRARGLAFNGLAGRNDVIAWVVDFNRSVFYVKAWYLDFIAAASVNVFEGLRQLKDRGQLPFERFIAVIPDGSTGERIEPELARWRKIGDLRRLEAPQVAAELPSLAVFCGGGGLWILTIR
jgi:hypothetical protein